MHHEYQYRRPTNFRARQQQVFGSLLEALCLVVVMLGIIVWSL